MEGIFKLSFSKEGDGPDDSILTTSFNHLTIDGMAALINRTPLPQPNVTVQNSGKYQNTINYFFFIIDDGQPVGFDLNEHDVKFSQIARFPNTYNEVNQYYSKTSAASGTLSNMAYPEGKDSITILAAGMAYKEVGGDGSNDFVWSISPFKTPVVLAKREQEKPEIVNLWTATYQYLIRFTGNTVPEIKVNVGGADYIFIRDPLGQEETNSYFINNGNILDRIDNDIAGFTINGAHGVPPSDFVELKTSDPLIRKFEITYTNRRAASSVDLTGFGISLGGTTFAWKLEHDKYIVLEAGKKFKITIAIGLETGQPAGVKNGNIDYAPTPYYTSTLGNVSELRLYNHHNLKFDTAVVTGCANTSKAVETVNKINPNKVHVYLSDLTRPGVYNTELTKLELGLSGRKGRPLYFLAGNNPTVVPIQKPDISASDCGWHVVNNKVIFRINVPADITHLQVALDDGVWHDFAVTAGASNDIELTKRFIYNGWLYLRWKNGSVTGVINFFNKRFNTGYLVVEPFYRYRHFKHTNDRNRDWYSIFGFAAAGYASNIPGPTADSDGSQYDLRFSVDTRGIYDRDRDSDYNSAWPNKSYTLTQTPLFFQNDLGFKAEVGLTNFTVTSNGNEQSLPWKTRATRPAVDAPVVSVTRTNTPRALILDLKPYPTAAEPNKITIECTLDARKAKLFRIHDGQLIAGAENVLKGQKLEFSIEEKLFNHLEYGIHYLTDTDELLSPVPVKFFGGSLDLPEQITDYAYDSVGYVISFTTPARATRASIKQFGIEVFSFECVQGGITKFFMSKPLNMTQRYELWLYNANNETWDEPYVIVDVDESDEKPTSTGPYTFPEWSNPTGSDVVESSTAFADIQRWVNFDFKARINGKDTDQFITRNEHGIITSIAFNAVMERFVWLTGYNDESTSYEQKPPEYSGLNVTYISTESQGLMVIDVWHEWAKYALIDEASFGNWEKGPAFAPYYGQTTGRFQKTEIVDGYIRNTYRMRIKPQRVPRVCPLYHLDITGYSKAFRNANIYIHPTDMLGSLRLNSYYEIDRFVPIIDGKEAKWDVTRNTENLITKLRCFNDDLTSFTYDATKPFDGWTFDNYDPAIDGTEGSEDIYHTLEFCLDKGYWDGNFMSYSHLSLYADKPGNVGSDINEYSYSNAIFAIVYPYAKVPNWLDDMGPNYSTLSYWENNPYSVNNEVYRFQDAFIGYTDYDVFKTKVDDSIVYINGEIATVTKETVTLSFTPTNTSNLGNYRNDQFSFDETKIVEPTLEEFTFEAIVVSTADFVLSNRSHPNVWTVDTKPIGQTNPLKMLFARKHFTEESYLGESVESSGNVATTTGVWYSVFRKYWATLSVVFHMVDNKLMKMEVDLPDPSNLHVDETKSIYDNKVLHTLINYLISNVSWYDYEGGAWVIPADFDKPIANFIHIDGSPFTIQYSPTMATDLEDTLPPFQRTMLTPTVKVFKTSDPTVYVEYNHLGQENYVGFAPGIHKLTINKEIFGELEYDWQRDAINNLFMDFDGLFDWSILLTKSEIGYVELQAVNWIVSDIGTGVKVNTNVMPFTLLDSNGAVEEFVPDFGQSFSETAPFNRHIDSPLSINPYYLSESGTISDKLDILLDGAPYDLSDVVAYNLPEPDYEGSDWYDRTDPTLVRALRFIWTSLRLGLVISHGPRDSNIRIYSNVETLEDFNNVEPMETYEGERHTFSLIALDSYMLNGHKPFTNLSNSSYELAFGIPVSNLNYGGARIKSVNNGDRIYTRLDYVIGKKPVTDESFDPTIGPSYYSGLSEARLLSLNPGSLGNGLTSGEEVMVPMMARGISNSGIYNQDQDSELVPNFYQYPHTAFEVTVNGKPATFISPAPEYGNEYTSIRLSKLPSLPEYGSDRLYDNGLIVVRAINSDGSLSPLGDITELYNTAFVGPGTYVESSEEEVPPPEESVTELPPDEAEQVGIYIPTVDAFNFSNRYSFIGIPTIHCEELGVYIVLDVNKGKWMVYTGQTNVPYVIEFRYKRVYEINDGIAPPVLDAYNIGGRYVSMDYKFLTANNFKALPNTEDSSKFDISWINYVNDFADAEYNDSGHVYMGMHVPANPSLEDHIPAIESLDGTYVKQAVSYVSPFNLAITINKVPAVLDLTEYTEVSAGTHANISYFVSEVEAENVYPELNSLGSFTAENEQGKIKYDVATASWTLLSSIDNKDVTVGIVAMQEAGPTIDVRNLGGRYIGREYVEQPFTAALAFELKSMYSAESDPTNVAEQPNLHDELISFVTAAQGNIILPNYELFNVTDYELIVNGLNVVTPTILEDTHGVPYKYIWSLLDTQDLNLVLDVESRSAYLHSDDPEFDWDNFPDGVLTLTRETNLDVNPETKLFHTAIDLTLQWNYKKLLDVTDVRPLFLDQLNTADLYLNVKDTGAIGNVIIQGSKKSVALASIVNITEKGTVLSSAKPEQLFYGWKPTGYTGISMAVHGNGQYVLDDLAAKNLDGLTEHPYEIELWVDGLSNDTPM